MNIASDPIKSHVLSGGQGSYGWGDFLSNAASTGLSMGEGAILGSSSSDDGSASSTGTTAAASANEEGQVINQNNSNPLNKTNQKLFVGGTLNAQPASPQTNVNDFVVEPLEKDLETLDWDSPLGITTKNVYAEARGQNEIEMQCVAEVIRNRVDNNTREFASNDTYEKVVQHKRDFSCTRSNDANYKAFKDPVDHSYFNNTSKKALFKSYKASFKALNQCSNLTSGATIYYSPGAMGGNIPKWDFSKLNEIKINGVQSNNFKFYKYK